MTISLILLYEHWTCD